MRLAHVTRRGNHAARGDTNTADGMLRDRGPEWVLRIYDSLHNITTIQKSSKLIRMAAM
jgi:hypothetical protein